MKNINVYFKENKMKNINNLKKYENKTPIIPATPPSAPSPRSRNRGATTREKINNFNRNHTNNEKFV
jgi:hypothetical protein